MHRLLDLTRRLVSAAVALILASAATAQDHRTFPPAGTVGVLTLPTLFGTVPCDRFQAKAVRLFAMPKSGPPIGELRVTSPWVFEKEGGCEGLKVQEVRGAVPGEAVPTLEYGYELPAAVVLARKGPWCQVELRSGPAWIREECGPGFIPVQDLLRDKPLYVRSGALAQATRRPGAAPITPTLTLPGGVEAYASLVQHKLVRGVVWIQLTASGDPCGSDPAPLQVNPFWLPLRNAAGELQVWFHSRGC